MRRKYILIVTLIGLVEGIVAGLLYAISTYMKGGHPLHVVAICFFIPVMTGSLSGFITGIILKYIPESISEKIVIFIFIGMFLGILFGYFSGYISGYAVVYNTGGFNNTGGVNTHWDSLILGGSSTGGAVLGLVTGATFCGVVSKNKE